MIISDVYGMKATIDTFIFLQRDIEQSFQRVQTICNSSEYDLYELHPILNHISCTLEDLQQINHLLNSSSTGQENHSSISDTANLLNITTDENVLDVENRKILPENQSTAISITTDQIDKNIRVTYAKENDELLASSNTDVINTNIVLLPSYNERASFIHHMKQQCEYYKNKIQPAQKKDSQMEIIQLDQVPDDDISQDRMIRQQDEHIDNMHHSIVSLKNLTQSINAEISNHLRVLDNLETGMEDSQNHVESLTNQTKAFIRTSPGGVGGHTCLFTVAVVLFFLIVILLLFF